MACSSAHCRRIVFRNGRWNVEIEVGVLRLGRVVQIVFEVDDLVLAFQILFDVDDWLAILLLFVCALVSVNSVSGAYQENGN